MEIARLIGSARQHRGEVSLRLLSGSIQSLVSPGSQRSFCPGNRMSFKLYLSSLLCVCVYRVWVSRCIPASRASEHSLKLPHSSRLAVSQTDRVRHPGCPNSSVCLTLTMLVSVCVRAILSLLLPSSWRTENISTSPRVFEVTAVASRCRSLVFNEREAPASPKWLAEQ